MVNVDVNLWRGQEEVNDQATIALAQVQLSIHVTQAITLKSCDQVVRIYLVIKNRCKGVYIYENSRLLDLRLGSHTILTFRSTPSIGSLFGKFAPQLRDIVLVLILLRDQALQPLVLHLQLANPGF